MALGGRSLSLRPFSGSKQQRHILVVEILKWTDGGSLKLPRLLQTLQKMMDL